MNFHETYELADMPDHIPLYRQISEHRWLAAAIHLENNPSLQTFEASHPRHGWSFIITRTYIKGIYIQQTYHNDELIMSRPMNLYALI